MVCQIKSKDIMVSDEVEHQFSFEMSSGGHSQYNGYMFMFFNKKNHRHLVVKNEKIDLIISSQYSLEQVHLALKIHPHFRLNCYSDEKFAQLSRSNEESRLDSELGDSQNLTQYKKNISFKIKRTLKFLYNQKKVQNGMRPIIFKNGRAFTSDNAEIKDSDHCTFQIKIKKNKDINIYAGTLLKVETIKELRNSAGRKVLSYSFVDPSSGKPKRKFTDFVPFYLNCTFPTEKEFTYKYFKEVTSDRIQIGLKK